MTTLVPTVLVLSPGTRFAASVWEALEASGSMGVVVETEAALGELSGVRPALVLLPEGDGPLAGEKGLVRISEMFPASRRILMLARDAGNDDLHLVYTQKAHLLLTTLLGTKALAEALELQVQRFEEQEDASRLSEMLRKRHSELESMTRHLEGLVERRTAQIGRAKRELEMTLDAITDPLTLVDTSFVIHRSNRTAASVARRDIRELPGSRCYEALFGRTEPCVTCPLVRPEAFENSSEVEADLQDERSGKSYHLSMFLGVTDQTAQRYICFYRDTTEENRLRKQVLQSEKMAAVGQLAGGVAHEINNPIGVILSFAQMSKTNAAVNHDDDLLDNLQEIEKAANRCKIIVRGLLDFSRPSLDEGFGGVDLNEVLENAWFLVSTQKAAKQVQVVRQFGADTRVNGNPNQLLQVFVNLVANAVQAMPQGGTLTLESGVDADGLVWAAVQDSGTGIAPENLKKVFEPFFTTKAPGSGTGLGLSVSYGIVDRHNGRMEVVSEPGQGARFTVHLPPMDD